MPNKNPLSFNHFAETSAAHIINNQCTGLDAFVQLM